MNRPRPCRACGCDWIEVTEAVSKLLGKPSHVNVTRRCENCGYTTLSSRALTKAEAAEARA